ncbi:MAG: copper oxidase, partial [Allorhizobium sp.]
EMRQLAAPLIVRSPGDLKADRQEVVMFLHDFSFKSPEEVMAAITGGHGGGHDMSKMGAAPAPSMDHSGMKMGGSSMGGMKMDMSSMQGMAMDLNDYNWDAYLTNDRTLSDPEIIMVEKGGRVKLRVINGASATVFWIDTGGLSARLVAVDGHAIAGLEGSRFGIAMGQRLDLDLELAGEGAWPVLASREGSKERTGLILATPGATIEKIPALGEADAP